MNLKLDNELKVKCDLQESASKLIGLGGNS